MRRFAIEKLKQWQNKKNRKPLVIMGARQVGKTWLMQHFGATCYDSTAYFSFYNNATLSSIFDPDYDVERILTQLGIAAGFRILPGKTLIIFDEIQNTPKAFESLKAFCEEAPDYHVVAAGSLLGVALHEGISYPVGKVDLLYLRPLCFREYLFAIGQETLSDALIFEDYKILGTFHSKYLYHLRNYFFVGGMPGIVEAFRLNKDYNEVREMQKDIVAQYRGDFGKHIGRRELPRIAMVWDSIPIQLAKENKKFFFGQMKKGARSAEFEIAIQWLVDCGLVHKVHRVNAPHVPLSAHKEMTAYKLFVVDIGLLCAMSELDASTLLDENTLFVEFKGALAEQYVLQEMIADSDYTPYYFGTEKATFEQDFLFQRGREIVPVEVKSSSNVRSQSLKSFCDKYPSGKAIRFSALEYIDQGWMENIPLYAVCRI